LAKGKTQKKEINTYKTIRKYKEFLANDAEIYFKTDDDDLFRASLGYFEEAGFEIINKTYDLHSEPIWENNIETEHEKMFSEQGIKIKALIAKCKE
jgi:tRNA (guanine-N7-)-methyltransferase